MYLFECRVPKRRDKVYAAYERVSSGAFDNQLRRYRIYFPFFFYTIPDSSPREKWILPPRVTRTPRHDFIFQRRKVFCIIYFTATSFHLASPLSPLFPPSVDANHAPFFWSSSFCLCSPLVSEPRVSKLSESITLLFVSATNYRPLPNQSLILKWKGPSRNQLFHLLANNRDLL